VKEEDIESGIVTKVNLDREWALGQFCHSIYIPEQSLLNFKVEQKLPITFIIGGTICVSK
jgi:hypothetical protein